MDKKQPLGNTELRAMIVIGALLAVIGLFVWLANADTSSGSLTSGDESSPTGQFLGSAIGLLGLMLLSLGWGAAAICRQIVNTEPRQLRSNAVTSTANRNRPSQPPSIGTTL